MKKTIIYYFSGTGNTWWIANALQQQLAAQNHQAQSYSIETLTPENVLEQVKDVNHIIFGFPVYGSTAPKFMINFINQFPNATNDQSASIFATQALASGDTAYHIGKMLIQKGYSLKQTMHFRMMNNFHIPKFRFYRPKNDYRVDKLHQKSLPKVKKLALAITNNQEHIIGKNIIDYLLGNFQRSHIDKVIDMISKEFKIDSTHCVNCGKCERICPTQNIKKCGDTYKFGDNCMLCLRCYCQCPKSAILIGEGTKNEIKYPRYKGPEKYFDINVLMKNNR
ncbi:EFR1 family ferrodoxin [Clostridium sp. MSJ-11]|uniref:EFR1 family ferrodoxin n=1 Tax=Clostridium mobile TaxID=2841512 RepID=A0ABS6EGX6_9CLOT|nr:EFR1 family ferrodoxin [Clostridium mobile]MBU5484392.1 EFR1 family ferrodoxin [Clostridium mobile]